MRTSIVDQEKCFEVFAFKRPSPAFSQEREERRFKCLYAPRCSCPASNVGKGDIKETLLRLFFICCGLKRNECKNASLEATRFAQFHCKVLLL